MVSDEGSFAEATFGFSVAMRVSAVSGSVTDYPPPEGPSLRKVGECVCCSVESVLTFGVSAPHESFYCAVVMSDLTVEVHLVCCAVSACESMKSYEERACDSLGESV